MAYKITDLSTPTNSCLRELDHLIARIKENPDTFQEIIVCLQQPVFRYLTGFRISPARVDELAQEVFLRVYKNLERYDHRKGASFTSWVFTIAKRLAINEVNRYEHSHRVDEFEITELPGADSNDPAQQLDTEQQQQLVMNAVNLLPDVYRDCLLLSYIRELTLEDIAKIEECSVGTIKSRLYRAKQQLAPVLAGLLSDSPD